MKTFIVMCTLYLARIISVGLNCVDEYTRLFFPCLVLLMFAVFSDLVMFKITHLE